MAIISMKCRACGGALNIDDSKEVLFCPYCGSKALIAESDEVKKTRIKYRARKEIELGKTELEEGTKQKENRHTFIIAILVLAVLVFMMVYSQSRMG